MKSKANKRSERIRSPDEIWHDEISQSARNGAAHLLGHAREDVLEEIAAITVEKYISRSHDPSRPINNPKSWAFRVGRNEAISWIAREQREESLDSGFTTDEGADAADNLLVNKRETPSFKVDTFSGSREEVLQALPELFEWFQSQIIDQLRQRDREFFEMVYVDRWSEEQIASKLNITPKAVAQRWRRLLLQIRKRLLQELPSWERGNELFAHAFRDAKNLVGLLCLIRIFLEQGLSAIRDLIDQY